MELLAQGAANIFSSIFGGIPAIGAIARTATNVKNGGRTPIAGIVHAMTLLLIMLFLAPYAKLIPMACLAGILAVVASLGNIHLKPGVIILRMRNVPFIDATGIQRLTTVRISGKRVFIFCFPEYAVPSWRILRKPEFTRSYPGKMCLGISMTPWHAQTELG
jgi:MFS superfamily sulfate permease-like transporter